MLLTMVRGITSKMGPCLLAIGGASRLFPARLLEGSRNPHTEAGRHETKRVNTWLCLLWQSAPLHYIESALLCFASLLLLLLLRHCSLYLWPRSHLLQLLPLLSLFCTLPEPCRRGTLFARFRASSRRLHHNAPRFVEFFPTNLTPSISVVEAACRRTSSFACSPPRADCSPRQLFGPD